MAAKLGLNAKLYRNTAGYASPAFAEVGNCKDVTVNLEKNTSDVTTRANNGWRAKVGVLKDFSIEFSTVDDTTDTHFAAFRDSFLNGTDLDMLALDEDADDATAEGIRAVCQVTKFSRKEPLEEAIMYDITLEPTYSPAHPPAWVSGSAYGAYE